MPGAGGWSQLSWNPGARVVFEFVFRGVCRCLGRGGRCGGNYCVRRRGWFGKDSRRVVSSVGYQYWRRVSTGSVVSDLGRLWVEGRRIAGRRPVPLWPGRMDESLGARSYCCLESGR